MKYKFCLFFSMLISSLAWIVRINPKSENSFYLNNLIELIYCCTWTSSALFFFFALKKTLEADKVSQELELLRKQQDMRTQNEAALKKLQKKAAQSQENAIKQLEYLQQCIQKEEYLKAERYIQDIAKEFNNLRYHPVCADSLINSILQGKKECAEEQGIRVEYNVFLPQNLAGNIHADLSGLFFNLLDNGIEGCLRSGNSQPFLSLQVKTHTGFLHITMINSKNTHICFTHRTTKEDALNHGFGLSIIEEIIEKHDGSYQWLDKSDTFESRLMLRYQ